MNVLPPLRLLEVNTPLIWHWPHFLDVVDLIARYRFNGLIVHQQNILALLARPPAYNKNPGIENLHHERESTLSYLQRVSHHCQSRNIQLWIQGEAFPGDAKIKQKFPEFFLGDETVANNTSFLTRFYSETVDEMLAALPNISGLILSLQTPTFHPEQWKQSMKVLHRILRLHGKKLVLRDYLDDSWPRRQLHNTLNSLPDDVRVSMKATAMDYRPGFANNPELMAFPGNKKWIEFDLWGIDYGWTLLPCMLVDEIQGRLSWAHAVAGDELEAISARISWEWISNSSLLESVNEINLYGLAQLINHSDSGELHAAALFQRWLHDNHVVNANAVTTSATGKRLDAVQTLFFNSYDWMCKTPYFLGRLLHRHSQLPHTLEQAIPLLHAETRSANWAQSFQPLFPVDDRLLGNNQYELVTLERQQSHFYAHHLRQSAREIHHARLLPDPLSSRLAASWDCAWWYTALCDHAKQLVADSLFAMSYGTAVTLHEQHCNDAQAFAEKLDHWLTQHQYDYPHFLRMLMAPERLHRLAESCRKSPSD